MMNNRDGHWWDKEMTIGWYVQESEKEWIGVIIIDGVKKTVCKMNNRGDTVKHTVKILKERLKGKINETICK